MGKKKILALVCVLTLLLTSVGCAKKTDAPAVPTVTVTTSSGFTGYGVPVGANLVITCWHIAEKEAATIDGYGSKLLYRNEDEDIALYKTKRTYETWYQLAESINGLVAYDSVQPGDSGKPVINKSGLLVGLVAGIDSEGKARYSYISPVYRDITSVILSNS